MEGNAKPSMFGINFAGLTAAAMFFVLFTAVGSNAAESDTIRQDAINSSQLPQRPSSVVKVSQLIAGGRRLGTVVWYDDSATPRPADYVEVYDSDGGLVAVAWFDRYGIERVAMDRAFIEGRERLEGTFIAVVDGDLM